MKKPTKSKIGAGRPLTDTARGRKKSRMVSVYDDDYQYLQNLGNGNASAGIEIVTAFHRKAAARVERLAKRVARLEKDALPRHEEAAAKQASS